MIGQIVMEYDIENDRFTKLGLAPCSQAPWFVRMILRAVLDNVSDEIVAQRLGAPRRFGMIELPPNGPR